MKTLWKTFWRQIALDTLVSKTDFADRMAVTIGGVLFWIPQSNEPIGFNFKGEDE